MRDNSTDNLTAENAGASEQTLPSSEMLQAELDKENYRNRFFNTFRSTVFGLITVAAMAILVAVLFLPVLHIYGQSMNGTLDNGDIVLSVKSSEMDTGEIVAFYYNNILVKRVIANSGDWVDIDKDGNVYVNQKLIDEPYLREPKAYGETDIELPYQVPENKVFVMGDNRAVSIDSRNTSVGCVDQEQVVGHIVLRVWPLTKIGFVK
ncbi:MAG: signal peptidase I [Lachnospiraceae bacterium]|nr:signal peptidase I [Lachnospiraceae bacterium]